MPRKRVVGPDVGVILLDGGFVIVGSTNSFGSGNSDVLVLKIDSNGNLLWGKGYRWSRS